MDSKSEELTIDRKLDFYIHETEVPFYSYGNLSKVMDKFKQSQGKGNKIIGVQVVDKNGKEDQVAMAIYTKSFINKILILPEEDFIDKIKDFPGDEDRIRKMYKELSDVLNHEKVRLTILEVLNRIKDDVQVNISENTVKANWFCRVVNSHKPQDYIEINVDLRKNEEQILLRVTSVHANEVMYLTEKTIDFTSIFNQNNDFDWNDEFEKSLEIKKMVDFLDTDYKYLFAIYSDDSLNIGEIALINYYVEYLPIEKRYEKAMELAGFNPMPVPEDSMATVGFYNPETGEEVSSDGWGGIADHLHNMVIADDVIAERINNLISIERKIQYYTVDETEIKEKGASPLFFGGIEEVMNKYNSYAGEKRIGISIEEEGGKDSHIEVANYSIEDNQHHILDNLQFNFYTVDFPGDEEKIMKMYDVLVDKIHRENVRLKILDVLDQIIDDVILPFPQENWYCRVANSHRPQDYIEISVEIRNKEDRILFDMKSVHANEILYATRKSVDYYFINNLDSLEEFDEELEIRKMVDLLDTDYSEPFKVYSDDFDYDLGDDAIDLADHFKELNRNGYDEYPSEPLTFTGDLQEILSNMSESDKEAHVQGVEAARDYNGQISDFDQKLYVAIIEERSNTEVYEVEIKEELSRTIKVRAGSLDEAMESIRKKYHSGEIVLDAEDFKEASINAISKEIQTNIGKVPIEDYREIEAMKYGFDSYEEMRSEGYCLAHDNFEQPEPIKIDKSEKSNTDELKARQHMFGKGR